MWPFNKRTSNLLAHAKVELQILQKMYPTKDNPPIIKDFIPEILALVDKVGQSGQSGGSIGYTASAIAQAVEKLCLFQTICPLTGEPDEWDEYRDGYMQNKRNGAVFKEEVDGKAYYLDAISWKNQYGMSYNGSADLSDGRILLSRAYIKSFPFEPKTFYIDTIEEEVSKGSFDFHIKDETQLSEVFEYYNPYYYIKPTGGMRIAGQTIMNNAITLAVPDQAKENWLQRFGDWIKNEEGVIVGDIESVFSNSVNIYNLLSTEEQQAYVYGSGILATLNKDLNALPADVTTLFTQLFPNISLDDIHGFIDEWLNRVNNIQGEVPLTLDDAIVAAQKYLAQYDNDHSTWGIISNAGASILATIMSPETPIEKFIAIGTAIYHAIVRPAVTAASTGATVTQLNPGGTSGVGTDAPAPTDNTNTPASAKIDITSSPTAAEQQEAGLNAAPAENDPDMDISKEAVDNLNNASNTPPAGDDGSDDNNISDTENGPLGANSGLTDGVSSVDNTQQETVNNAPAETTLSYDEAVAAENAKANSTNNGPFNPPNNGPQVG